MGRAIVLLVFVSLIVQVAAADPSNLANGVFIAHHPAGLEYSQGQDWCQRYVDEFAISDCKQQHNRIDLNGNLGQSSVWYVLAAWTEDKEWCGTEFGFGQYDANIYGFLEWGPCSPESNLEIPSDGWPGPIEGTAITTTGAAWSGNFVPVYYFAGYAYYEGIIPLGVDPATDFSGTGNCDIPPESWVASKSGGMGLFRNGIYACPSAGGFGPEGPEAAACCLQQECLIATADECERLGGEFHPEWDSCTPNPCRALGPEGGDQCDCSDRDDHPLDSQLYCADPVAPNVFFLDPGTNHSLRFELENVECTGTTALLVQIYDPPSNESAHEEHVVFGGTPVVVGPIEWPRDRGMAKVVLTTEGGEGSKYAFRPASVQMTGGRDREYFNSNTVARTTECWPGPWHAHYELWVPTMAQSMELKCMHPYEGTWGSELFDLKDPHGNVVLRARPGNTFELDIPDSSRGGTWELIIYPEIEWLVADVCGTLQVAFKAAGTEEWWVPDYAFSPVPENPVRAQLAPHDLRTICDPLCGEAVTYYVPYGCPRDDYQEEDAIDPSQALVGQHRQWFAFIARGSQRTARVTRYWGGENDTMWVEWYNTTENWIHFTPLITGDLPLEVPECGALFLRIPENGPTYDVTTDAPLAVCGPTPGLRWGRFVVGGVASSRDYWFYVPPENEKIEMSLEAWRYCAEWPAECRRDPREEGGYYNRTYAETHLILTDPGGNTYDFPTDAHGRVEVSLTPGEYPLGLDEYPGQYRGHAWGLRVDTYDNHGGLHVDLVFGDDLPPYVTWLEKERLFLPTAFSTGPLMVHEVQPFTFSWEIGPAADVYFGHARTCWKDPGQAEWQCSDPIYELDQSLQRLIMPPGDDPHKEVEATLLSPWIPWGPDALESFRNQPNTAYAVPRPVGLSEDGSMRTSFDGVPGESEQFVSMYAAMGVQDYPSTLGEGRLAETAAAGFHTGQVCWNNNPPYHDGIWIQIAYQQQGLYSSIVAPWRTWARFREPPDWEAFEWDVMGLHSRDPLIYFESVSEPLLAGVSTDRLYESIYRARKQDTRHPIALNDEPGLVNMKEVRDIAEVWSEDEYFERARGGPGDYNEHFALCEIATRISELQSRVRPDVATKLFMLGGFYEKKPGMPEPKYVTAGSDTAAIQGLTALLLGVDVTCIFLKICAVPEQPGVTVDLDDMNRDLWNSFSSLNATLDKVRRWKGAYEDFVGFGGTTVLECELPPVIYGHGFWNEGLQDPPPDSVGIWYAFANLGHEDQQVVSIAWDDLHLYGGCEEYWLVEDDHSANAPLGELVQYDHLSYSLPPRTWVVGRVVGEPTDPSGVRDGDLMGRRFSLAAIPNPFASGTVLRLSLGEDSDVLLSLYSICGRKVREVELTGLRAGTNDIFWDGRDSKGRPVPNGVYYARAHGPNGEKRSCWMVRLN